MNTLTKKYGSSSLVRPQFSPGLLLEDDDLNTGVTYARDFTRLMFRSLFGCGVICGLKVSGKQVSAGTSNITVSKGLALDCMGNPIEVPVDVTIDYTPDCGGDFKFPIWVVACYTEKACRPKEVACSQEDDAAPRPTRLRSGYEIRLYASLPSCSCHCPVEDDNPQQTATDGCCEDAQATPASAPNAANIASGADGTICPCFSSHFNGECECGSNCSCVVIGKIVDLPLTDPQGNPIMMQIRRAVVDDSMVRRIRPMLNGYVLCKQAEKPRSGNDQPPARPV